MISTIDFFHLIHIIQNENHVVFPLSFYRRNVIVTKARKKPTKRAHIAYIDEEVMITTIPSCIAHPCICGLATKMENSDFLISFR